MSQTYRTTPVPATPGSAPSAWAGGWTVFASVIMVVQGCWGLIAGLVALVNDEFLRRR